MLIAYTYMWIINTTLTWFFECFQNIYRKQDQTKFLFSAFFYFTIYLKVIVSFCYWCIYINALLYKHVSVRVRLLCAEIFVFVSAENETIEAIDLSWNNFRLKSALSICEGIAVSYTLVNTQLSKGFTIWQREANMLLPVKYVHKSIISL